MILPEQVRAARALLKIDQGTLAERAGVSIETIKRFERSDGQIKAQESTIASIGTALEKSGIVFVRENEKSLSGGAGVRFAEKIDADQWNRQLDEVLSSVAKELTDYEYEKVITNYKMPLNGEEYIRVEDLSSLVPEILEHAKNLLRKTSVPFGDDLFTQRDEEE